MQKYLKNMPNYEELNEKYKNMKIKIGKLKVIPNENGKK
jgi:hypothetical protein